MTAYRIKYGLYEFLVIVFQLANAPSSFHYYMNNTLLTYLKILCIAYQEKIVIYNEILGKYWVNVHLVF